MERPQLSDEASVKLQEGINLLLSRWSSLQVAVENEFGGRDSRKRSQQLPIDIFSWFTQSKGPIYIDELEDMLDDFMLSLNTELDDGSIEELVFSEMLKWKPWGNRMIGARTILPPLTIAQLQNPKEMEINKYVPDNKAEGEGFK
ncbi:hypothetical protein AgCh_006205 [Apium graveolens]